MSVALVIVAVLVIAVIGFLVWFFKFRDPLAGEDFYKFYAEQKWAWELILTPEQEKAFMTGLEAYDENRGSVFPKREEGILRVRRPLMLVSLFWMTEQFAAMGPAAVQDPARAVEELLERAAQGEDLGILYIDDEWVGEDEEIDGMDKDEFASAVLSATMAQGVDHEFAGGFSDEDYGYATMGVLLRQPEQVEKMYDRALATQGDSPELNNRLDIMKMVMKEPSKETMDAYEAADAEKSKYVNTLMFCFERILAEYRQARPHMQGAEPTDVLKVVMARMLEQGMPGCTWSRPPTEEQHNLALALLSNRN